MLSKPRCSVVLPTYNRVAVLPRAVSSVLEQEMADFELLIVDDCSTDETVEWLSRLRDPRIRVLRADANLGPGGARNLGLAAACADITAFLDSDDAYLPRRLSVALDTLDAEPDVVCTLSSSEKHDEHHTRVFLHPDIKLLPSAFRWALMCGLVGVEGTSITVRTAAARAIGGFCVPIRLDEDGEFLIRLSGLGSARLLPDVLFQKFWSKDGLSQATRNAGENLLSYVAQRPEFLKEFHKLGSYRATKILVADLRQRDIRAFFADLSRFRAAGLLNSLIYACKSHREVGNYRRRMKSHEALASLEGPPRSWA